MQKYQNCFLASEILLSCFDLLVCILTEHHHNTQTLPHLEHTEVWETSTPGGTTPHPQSQHSCPGPQNRIKLSSRCNSTMHTIHTMIHLIKHPHLITERGGNTRFLLCSLQLYGVIFKHLCGTSTLLNSRLTW